MKILVFGAGVLGCNLARNLFRVGKDVTLLARGSWAEEIRQNGLRIKDKFSPRVSVSRIPVTTELKPETQYDVIFVVLRYGEKEGHMKKAIQKLWAVYPGLTARCFRGFGHGDILNHPALLVSEPEQFLTDGGAAEQPERSRP